MTRYWIVKELDDSAPTYRVKWMHEGAFLPVEMAGHDGKGGFYPARHPSEEAAKKFISEHKSGWIGLAMAFYDPTFAAKTEIVYDKVE